MKAIRLVPSAPEPVADIMFDPCVKCTICMEACPVARVTDSFPGPKMAGPDAQRFRGRFEQSTDNWIELCSSCRSCQTVCPSNVPIADINILAKARHRMQTGSSMATAILSHAHLVAKFGASFAPIANKSMRSKAIRLFAEKLFGVSAHAPLPSFASKKFSSEIKNRIISNDRDGLTVVYFHGCYTENNRPDLGLMVIDLLERFGCRVQVPGQNCCGVALVGVGDLKSAYRLAYRNYKKMAHVIENSDYLVFASPSCQLALTAEYTELLHFHKARIFTEKSIDLMSLLEHQIEAKGVQLPSAQKPMKLAYHTACHLKALGIGLPAVRVLRSIEGIDLTVLDAGCCGLAGTFGMKAVNRDISLAIGKAVADRIYELNPDMVVSECEGCRMMIESMTGKPAMHPAEILAALF